MATIVRLKRRRNEDPVEALLLSCKKRKEDGSFTGDSNLHQENPEDVKETLKFAGTIASNEASISKHIRAAIRQEKLAKEYKQHSHNTGQDLVVKSRLEKQVTAKESRYKVVCSHRELELDNLDTKLTKSSEIINPETETTLDGAAVTESPSKKVFYLYDVERDISLVPATEPSCDYSDITCNRVPLIREKTTDEDFVYDLYYTNSGSLDFQALQNALTIEALQEDLVYVDDRFAEDDEVYDDDDDSNDENNWRNDYPDDDPDIGYNADEEPSNYVDPLSSLFSSRCCVDYEDNDIGDIRYDNDIRDDNGIHDDDENISPYDEYRRRMEKELLDEYVNKS